MEPPRPPTELGPAARLRATVDWIGPGRIASGALSVLLAAGAGWWLLRPAEPPIEQSLPFSSTTSLDADSSSPATSPIGTSAAPPAVVVVHVAGAVASPGVYELRSGARVHDAIAAAGGAVGDAELDALNLASLLGDGERVYVPRPGEAVIAPVDQGRAQPQTPLDLNTATAEELDALPGVGPSIARSIVDDRNRNGPFAAVDDLTRVRGIGPAKLEELRSLVRV